ncbi:MAG TPA: prenyltransferase/squalene oxidase repeat-containing protein [Solirubrobacterales bacterium]|jgi:hypothetical protein|nr:prenyltransferase/squalene oxidase repeat-containing protein [Solirubrobacterales bacterium]
MATYGGDLSLQRFGVLEARAIPFDAALRGVAAALLLLLVLALGALMPAPAFASSVPADASSIGRAAAWLELAQNADGGFGPSEGDDSRTKTTCWVMLGLEASGRNPLDVARAGRTPIDFLLADIDAIESSDELAPTIIALEGSGLDPHSFGGRNLVAELIDFRRDDGSYQGRPSSTAFAVIALRAAGTSTATERSLDWLHQVQNDDGGWGNNPGSPSTVDATGAVLQALSPDSKAAHRAVDFLQRQQRKGGGFPRGRGAVNTQSTAWAIQGLLAAGRNPSSFKRGGVSAPEYLANNQRDDGSYRYAKPNDATPAEVANQTPVLVTGEALVAAAGKYLPIAAPPRQKKEEPSRANFKGSSGLPPSTSVSPSATESLPTLPSGSGSGAGGIASGHSAPSGQKPSGAQPGIPSIGRRVPKGSSSPAPATSAPGQASGEQAAETTDNSSTAGAILLGLLAGCLLFAVGLGARRGWMRWRYGL